MPTGQQLYSPTGFLPVPMSSPSGYAAGDLCLYLCVQYYERVAQPKLNYSIGDECRCGNGGVQFPVKAGNQLPWEFKWLDSHGKNGHSLVSTCWFPDTSPTSKLTTGTYLYVLASIYPSSTVLVMTYHGDLMLAISHASGCGGYSCSGQCPCENGQAKSIVGMT